MANTLNVGNGDWATKENSLLGYNSENGNYKPLPFDFTRASNGTFVNKSGLIETAASGVPRIDFLGNTSGALLLEPQRTNSLLQSNQFDTTWSLSTSIDLTSGQNGVYGSNNAWLLKRNGTGSRYIQQSLSLSSAQYSYSVYLKAESTNWAYVWSYDGSASVNAYFDLENGVVGQIGGAALNSTNIESVGNGWYRCTLIYTHAPNLVRIYPAYSNGDIATGTDNGIYIQYAQLEVGSYATSLINTQGSAVTRVADACSQTPPSGIIGQTEGVFYLDFKKEHNGVETWSISDGTSSNRVYMGFNGSDFISQVRSSSGSAQASFTTALNNNTRYKCALAYKLNDFVLYINGVQIGTDNNGVVPLNMSKLSAYASTFADAPFFSPTNDVKLYNTRLSNSELAALTT
jgi:hypothetical protein